MKSVTILGTGSWATGLARVLLDNGHRVTLWGRDKAQIAHFKKTNRNSKFMPDQVLTGAVHYSLDLAAALQNIDFLVNAVPTQHVRSLFGKGLPLADDVVIVNAAKGLEIGSNKRISEIVAEYYPQNCYAVLSGPSHAEEVVRRLPTILVAAARDGAVAEAVQTLFMNNAMRVYAQSDVKGVELSGALKNVIAIAAGISAGLGYGDNTLAALMTRGIAEIKRLGAALGAERQTFDGLAGIGDLIVTCMSKHSRNRRCGQLLGTGYRLDDAIAEIGMAVEGVSTIRAAEALRRAERVEMPIVEQLYKVLYEGANPQRAVQLLMARDKKSEIEID